MRTFSAFGWLLCFVVGANAQTAAKTQKHPPEGTEFAEMLASILSGSKMGPGDGWFHSSEKAHTWEQLAAWHGIKPTGKISKKQFKGPPEIFTRLDRDGDGSIAADDFDWSEKSTYLRQLSHARQVLRRGDKDNDGTLSIEEWDGLFKRAVGDDSEMTPEKLRAMLYPPPAPPQNFSNPADEPSMATLLMGLFKAEIGGPLNGPHVGDQAPDFRLKPVDGGNAVSLSQFKGKSPVVLCFGNFSCGPYRSQYQYVEALKKAYGDKVTFLGVYVREAHPTDGWRMFSNDRGGVSIAQPKTLGERWNVAETCSTKLKMTMPLLVDEIADTVGIKYSGMPSRLYLIDRTGKVLYKSGRGPFGFKPGELDQAISLMLTNEAVTKPAKSGKEATPKNEQSSSKWNRLPETDKPMTGSLPVWAETLSGPLPRTTAAMLELDYLQRAKSPLDPKLRAKIRWAAAHANRCSYGEAYALADLRRAGASEADVKALVERVDTVPEAEQLALKFATELTKRAANVTDRFYEQVRSHYSDEQIVAMVLCVAYANFQDRLALVYGWKVEKDGPVPPINVAFRSPYEGAVGGPRKLPANAPVDVPAAKVTDPEWLGVKAANLRQSMETQSARKPRIAVPTFEMVKQKLPPNTFPPGRTMKINWSLVCAGYQPTLAQAWIKCLRTFEEESKQDRVFEECLFWVVTRSLDCFY